VIGNTIHASFLNAGTCTTTVGIAAYQGSQSDIENQTLYSGVTAQLGPGGTITLYANLPPCSYQADAFFGPIITSFAGGVRYANDNRLLGFTGEDRGNCDILGCTRTIGYWKNHPEAWPVQSLTLGTVTYTQAQLLSIFNQPVKGNGLVSLAQQLIAAKLNQLSGASTPQPAGEALAAADTLIGSLVVPPVGNGFLSPAVTSGLTSTLDQYNQGLLSGGPSHCPE
jgi:hypothetical protein